MAEKESEGESGTSLDVPAVREAAKWLLTAFAGVGAVLVGGLQFSTIGKLGGEVALLAFAGVALAMSGILLAIFETSNVLVTRVSSIAELSSDKTARQFLDEHQDIVGKEFRDLDDFISTRQEAWTAYKSLRAGKPEGVTEEAWQKSKAQLIEKRNLLEHYEKVAGHITEFWRFERVCMAFEKARRKSFAGALMATVGIGAFAYATNLDGSSPYVDSPSAVAVTYQFSESGYRSLLEDISTDCLPKSGSATVLDGWPQGTDVIIAIDSPQCHPLRLKWNDQIGSMRARQPPPASQAPQ